MNMRTIFQSAICVLPFALAGWMFLAPTHAAADTGQYFYDDLGRVQTVQDTAGNVAVYAYDAVGNVSSITRFTPLVGY
jgi:YD repeat-containing protein